jgi:hypothetical protein
MGSASLGELKIRFVVSQDDVVFGDDFLHVFGCHC